MNWTILLAALIAIPVLDFLWLGIVTKKFYVKQMNAVGRIENGSIKPVYWAAFCVYVVLALGLTYLAGDKIASAESVALAAIPGAIFGFVTYGTYDFTNHATLKSWPLPLLAADIAWGTAVCAVAAVIGRFFI